MMRSILLNQRASTWECGLSLNSKANSAIIQHALEGS